MSYNFPWLSVAPLRNELENKSGIYFEANAFQESLLLQEPKACFLELARKIGHPLSQSIHNEFVLDVIDHGFSKEDQRARGPHSNRKLGFHTDRCDVIGFLCLRAAATGGENQIVNSKEVAQIIQKERKDLYEVLCTPFPYKRHVMDSKNPKPFCMQPIFSSQEGFFACSYLRVLIDRADQDPDCPDLSKVQKESLDFMDCVCEREEIQTRFRLEPGNVLFLNNWTTLHRRTAFTDYPEKDRQRYFLRVWLSMPNNRPLDPAFKENFGSVEAGKIRGGIRAN